jgi:L,D-transpeptidase ErfK/SrfK
MQERTSEWDMTVERDEKPYRPSMAQTFLKVLVVFFFGILFSLLLAWPVFTHFNKIQEMALKFKPKVEVKATASRIGVENLKTYKAELEKELGEINKKLDSYLPKGYYLIVNTSGNNFVLMNGDEVKLEGQCSTGSYTVLQAGPNKQWIFATPRGQFKIKNKKTEPVWKKPDWAFVEEGKKIPSANHPSRFEYNVLGDYAMELGQGYMIHGTLYKRFLGLPVTHGCIRMGDDDLEAVYKALPIGSKVFIY